MRLKFHIYTKELCMTLCDPMDYSPPGVSAHGIFQARILERLGIEPKCLATPVLQADSLPLAPPGKPRVK